METRKKIWESDLGSRGREVGGKFNHPTKLLEGGYISLCPPLSATTQSRALCKPQHERSQSAVSRLRLVHSLDSECLFFYSLELTVAIPFFKHW